MVLGVNDPLGEGICDRRKLLAEGIVDALPFQFGVVCCRGIRQSLSTAFIRSMRMTDFRRSSSHRLYLVEGGADGGEVIWGEVSVGVLPHT